ncbi:MAG: alpha/beta hydrolase [Desulfitobacteriaceae bacterium]
MQPIKRLVEPFYFPGNQVGCLLIHGFTGAPSEMRFLGERLAAYGWTILGIRLSGHGTTPEEMAKTGWKDWEQDAQSGVAELRRTCHKVVAVGLSMGGLLSLDLATKDWVNATVSLNAPMLLSDWRTRLAGLAKPFIRYARKSEEHRKAARNLTLDDPERFAYTKVPMASLDSLNRAIRQVRRNLGSIHCPTLLMQSVKDKTVSPESVRIIEKGLVNNRSRVVYWANSGHILTLGPEREAVALEVARFIQEHVAGSADSGH